MVESASRPLRVWTRSNSGSAKAVCGLESSLGAPSDGMARTQLAQQRADHHLEARADIVSPLRKRATQRPDSCQTDAAAQAHRRCSAGTAR